MVTAAFLWSAIFGLRKMRKKTTIAGSIERARPYHHSTAAPSYKTSHAGKVCLSFSAPTDVTPVSRTSTRCSSGAHWGISWWGVSGISSALSLTDQRIRSITNPDLDPLSENRLPFMHHFGQFWQSNVHHLVQTILKISANLQARISVQTADSIGIIRAPEDI